MEHYIKPMLDTESKKFETVFAKKSGHRDNGNGKSHNTGNIFGELSGNNGKNWKHK